MRPQLNKPWSRVITNHPLVFDPGGDGRHHNQARGDGGHHGLPWLGGGHQAQAGGGGGQHGQGVGGAGQHARVYGVVETTVMVCQGLVLGIRVRLEGLVYSMVMGIRLEVVADIMSRPKGMMDIMVC